MRDLFAFLVRFNSFFIFLFFETISFTLIIRFNEFHRNTFINSSNFFSASVYNVYNETFEYLNLKGVNDSLMVENARLRKELAQSFQSNSVAPNTLRDSTKMQFFTYMEAGVINNSTNKLQNFLTLNRGRKSGIEPGMGVIGLNGVVGIVTAISENFSSVMSVLNNSCPISARLVNQNYPGIVAWNGKNPLIASLQDIPKHVEIDEGDKVVTSGFSSIFPPNIPVGEVKSASEKAGHNFMDISINLSTDFSRLHYVYVVQNIHKPEWKTIESR